ncbi:glutamate racemase [Enterovirga rhinocerotis]|uniref:Glutamate racemase n=1 Tax=Enterovirga rhinocerotis TaxID=1339210 RepID=A0A4R7C3P8_9HYPH|nr:glutamate racemase [Enterovirga rhinocerotis]TDR93120.1 glutamate racemase [Enterovirga rhinocerotis]
MPQPSIDLLAGITTRPVSAARPRPTILLLDSGVGGLTVLREVRRARPDADYVYAADDAAFPYGDWAEEPLVRRVADVTGTLVERYAPDLVVVACNTISTLVLPTLRERFRLPFVGTVPAIKPAVAQSRTGRIAVLATPGTVRRDYTRGLVDAYSGGCAVDLVGSTRLAAFAEAELAGEPVPDEHLAAEIAPCFAERGGRCTDVVVLACTHYPLLVERMRRLAPWPVAWIDPASAIARRVVQILGDAPPGTVPSDAPGLAAFTGEGRAGEALRASLGAFGLGRIETGLLPVPPSARDTMIDAAAAAA